MELEEYRKKIENLSEEDLKKRNIHLSELVNNKKLGPLTGFTSIDKPQFRIMQPVDYNHEYCKKTIYEMAKEKLLKHKELNAMDYYGQVITNDELLKNIDKSTKAYQNIGVKNNDIVLFMGLNTPEVTYSLYAVNRLGAASEWFNPSVISPTLLKEHIIKNNIKTIFTIDIAYDLVKKAIEGTGVENVIVNSLTDSFSQDMKRKYNIQVYGINMIIKSKIYNKLLSKILNKIDYQSDSRQTTYSKEKLQTLSKLEQKIFKLYQYSEQEKIKYKASFKTNNKDSRFISWNDFIKKEKLVSEIKEASYQDNKTTIIVHTGGTTGPAKRVAHTDYSANSALYQASFLPIDFQPGDKIAQIIPPIVAWGLEDILAARYFCMQSMMTASYDRNEFVPFLLKTKSNHYFTVPSFVETILDNPLLDNVDLSFIKSINYGGEALDKEKERKIDETLKSHNCSISGNYGYGQNEDFGCVTLNVTVPGKEKIYGTCGIPIVENEFLLLDENGEEVRYGKDENGNYRYGNFYLSGPITMKGYIGDASKENEKTIKYIHGKKYINTGDVTYIDEDGRIGEIIREGRIIRTQDGKIFTTILESILESIPEIKESVVVEAPNPTKVKEASCHIVLKEEYRTEEKLEPTIKKIINIMEEKTNKMYTYYVPGTYQFRFDDLPRTASMNKKDVKKLEKENIKEYEENGSKPLKKIRILQK